MIDLNNLYQKMEQYDDYVIFGASEIGWLIKDEIGEYCDSNGKKVCFADNSYKKWDKSKSIISLKAASESFRNALWIIASDLHNQAMFDNLTSLGVKEKDIIKYPPHDILVKRWESERLRRLNPQKELSLLDVDIARHCNLNCAGCNVFSPLVDEAIFTDRAIFSSDMERLSSLLHANLATLEIMGGEPLLNPQVDTYLHIARNYFVSADICLVTNGLLLMEMPEGFWKACRENAISIQVTRYLTGYNYNNLRELAHSYGVKFDFFGISVDKTSWNIALDPSGKQDATESFCNCYYANKCARLNNGKLATCPVILNIDYFNSKFGTEMRTCSDDYIDIYKAKNENDILDFLCSPVPFCRFCDVKNRTYDNPWRISSCSIDEWVMK